MHTNIKLYTVDFNMIFECVCVHAGTLLLKISTANAHDSQYAVLKNAIKTNNFKCLFYELHYYNSIELLYTAHFTL